jgi:hypothetical protein
LAQWNNENTLNDWLERQLRDHYPFLRKLTIDGADAAHVLLVDGRILPILDGFDELPATSRADLLDQLNAKPGPLVITSRLEEYADAISRRSTVLADAAGFRLNDLRLTEVGAYLRRGARPLPGGKGKTVWDPVLDFLDSSTEPAAIRLATVLANPLMASLARTVYRHGPANDPADLLKPQPGETEPTVAAIQNRLLDGYVPALFSSTAGSSRRSRYLRRNASRAVEWLRYLAVRMTPAHPEVAWWELETIVPWGRRMLSGGLLSGLIFGAAGGFILGQFGTDFGRWGAAVGGFFGFACGILAGHPKGAGVPPASAEFRPFTPRLSRLIKRWLVDTAIGFLSGGAGAMVIIFLNSDPPVSDETMLSWLRWLLPFSLLMGLLSAGQELRERFESSADLDTIPNPPRSLMINRAVTLTEAGIFAVVTGLTTAFIFTYATALQTTAGSILVCGGAAAAAYFTLFALLANSWGRYILFVRVPMTFSRKLPWQLMRFLTTAHDVGVLRQAGATYQFRHDLLRERLAETFERR